MTSDYSKRILMINWKLVRSDNSTWSLLAISVLVFLLAVMRDANPMNLLWMFWAEMIIVFIFYLIKIRTIKHFSIVGSGGNFRSELSARRTFFIIAIFIYSLVTAVFLLIFVVFISMLIPLGKSVNIGAIFISSGFYAIHHMIIFLGGKKDKTPVKMIELLFSPISRFLPLMLMAIFSGFIFAYAKEINYNARLGLIGLFMLIKILFDLLLQAKKQSNISSGKEIENTFS
jgi:hypothetical protein